MSNPSQRDPLHEMMALREAMDRLFDEAFTRPFTQMGGADLPSIDMYQTENDVVVKAALPGLNPDDVSISVTADILTLKGDFKQEDEVEEARYHIREHRHGIFERSIMLPAAVQPAKAQANFDRGMLTITLPKTETVKPKTVNIKVK